MTVQRYSVTPQPIDILLSYVRTGEIAIPEIQRPFVWEPTKVRNFLDSLYKGYPVGYLILWKNPTVKLKDGSFSAGKKILIDGQQRITALIASILGWEVINKDYESVRIKIAFNPIDEVFEVANPAIQKDVRWLPDISVIFQPSTDLFDLTKRYVSLNEGMAENDVMRTILKLQGIFHNQVGVIELAEDLDIDTVTEIFIRVNSAGTDLSQADFAMSKIASNEKYGGNEIRKAIDYFCHLSVDPDFYKRIEEKDEKFKATDFYQKMRWVKDVKDDLYDPSYTDMLRVAFTSEFGRGKLQDLVALLSGRNFETRGYEDSIAEESFGKLKQGIHNFIRETHFKRMVMILESAGFISNSLISSNNAINFAYIVYLRGKKEGLNEERIGKLVRKWFVMAMLTGRYSGSTDSLFDSDIRQIEANGLEKFAETIFETTLSEGFWISMLPQQMNTSSGNSPTFLVYKASQSKDQDKGFLSRDITVQSLILNKSDVHHIFPKEFLKRKGLQRSEYNQIANFVVCQVEINIAIGDSDPKKYFGVIEQQTMGGLLKYGGIDNKEELKKNLVMNCIPEGIFGELSEDYPAFLEARRKLMALKIRDYFNTL